MTTRGLSLVGFLEEKEAILLLRKSCFFADESDASLSFHWRTGNQKLGPPIARAGSPDIQPIPTAFSSYVSDLQDRPWFKSAVEESKLTGIDFQMVELEPLLAMQYHVDLARCDHHCGGDGMPTEEQLFKMCLPTDLAFEGVNVSWEDGQNSVLIVSKGMNFVLAEEGWMERDCGFFAGVRVASKLPLLHVVKFNDKCYLHNGFHRAVGLRKRGITHAPCLFRDVSDYSATGLDMQNTFSSTLLGSTNPPTVAHFTEERALEVFLKTYTKTVHVSWAEHLTTDDQKNDG